MSVISSLGTKLVQAAQKEAAMRAPLPLQAEASEGFKGGELKAEVTLADNGRFAHLAQRVVVRAERLRPVKSRLSNQERAEKFAESATYLTETLQFVECDAQGAATLRSSPQTMRAKRAEYFEAKVTNEQITVQRFKPREAGPGREVVPFTITDDVLGRLCDDAARALMPKR